MVLSLQNLTVRPNFTILSKSVKTHGPMQTHQWLDLTIFIHFNQGSVVKSVFANYSPPRLRRDLSLLHLSVVLH